MFAISARRLASRLMLAFSVLLLSASPTFAQVKQIDPNDAIDADLGTPPKVDTSADPTITDVPLDTSTIEPVPTPGVRPG